MYVSISISIRSDHGNDVRWIANSYIDQDDQIAPVCTSSFLIFTGQAHKAQSFTHSMYTQNNTIRTRAPHSPATFRFSVIISQWRFSTQYTRGVRPVQKGPVWEQVFTSLSCMLQHVKDLVQTHLSFCLTDSPIQGQQCSNGKGYGGVQQVKAPVCWEVGDK